MLVPPNNNIRGAPDPEFLDPAWSGSTADPEMLDSAGSGTRPDPNALDPAGCGSSMILALPYLLTNVVCHQQLNINIVAFSVLSC